MYVYGPARDPQAVLDVRSKCFPKPGSAFPLTSTPLHHPPGT